MKSFLVGGAVRDKLLGINVKDRDYVVVGATPEKMLALGYQQVGKSFPVFLHPETKEEYALARTEKKIASGYHGFECLFDASVTLEEDLQRRDLTINAIAQDLDNHSYIDPFDGLADLNRRLLRHVSDAFREDPVRVLRAARFAAQLAPLGFKIDIKTNALMYQMVKSGEVKTLVAERVWLETEKALGSKSPHVFFNSLRACGALAVIFPEINALYGVPATKFFHGEIDTGVHTMMVLEQATLLTESIAVRFAALVHDLGKALTPFAALASHPEHAEKGVILVENLCLRLKVPKQYQNLAVLAARLHTRVHKCLKASAELLLNLLYDIQAFKKPSQLKALLLVCQADALGRISKSATIYPQAKYLWQAYLVANDIDVQVVIQQGATGRDIQKKLKEAQCLALSKFIKENKDE